MSSLTILVVDDDAIICDLLAEELSDQGYKTLTANSGDDAWKIIQSEHVDCVVSDVRMPNGDGLKLLENINRLAPTEKPVVVLVSGFSDLSKKDAIERGAEDLISKPINFKSLVKTIETQVRAKVKKVGT